MDAAPVSHLLYLHGFRSSPQSAKARHVGGWLRQARPDVTWWCPQLPPSPAAALALLDEGVAGWPAASSAVVGSSLGGYYATVLAERSGWRAALFNPAVEPARDLAAHIGETTAWHGDDRFFFRAEFIGELQAMRPAAITRPDRYLPIIATGDEVLDWREMHARYAACPNRLLIAGSDHALSDFAAPFDALLAFLALRPAAELRPS